MRVVIDTSAEPACGALGTLEAALQAWADGHPDGYRLPEADVPRLLETAVVHVPRAADTPRTTAMIVDMFFPPVAEELSVFQRMLKPRDGQVHFLQFWRAFGEATRLLRHFHDEAAPPGASVPERLAEEVEALRDAAIRTSEDLAAADAGCRWRRVLGLRFARLARDAAEMSVAPAFWHAMVKRLPTGDALTRDDIAAFCVSWLREAAAWRDAAFASSPASSSSSSSSGEASRALPCLAIVAASMKPTPWPQVGLPVFVHIYDVSHEDTVRRLNKVLAHKRNPFKFGGVFHAGVEVNGLEWSFGMTFSDSLSGVSCTRPMQHEDHQYRQTVRLRNTRLSAEEVADVLAQLVEEYPGSEYDLLRRNCCHFADDFVQRLGAGRLPGWVYRLARLGAALDKTMQRVSNRSLLSEEFN